MEQNQVTYEEQTKPPRLYSEAERKRRWALIVDAILRDPGPPPKAPASATKRGILPQS